jgi:hypothetical protein
MSRQPERPPMSRQPERRGDSVPTRDGTGVPETGEPPPFDTETRLDHTDVDSERMERLMGGRSRRGGGRREPRQGGKQDQRGTAAGTPANDRTDDA